jgi:hypothetical protein
MDFDPTDVTSGYGRFRAFVAERLQIEADLHRGASIE